jgi:hypothetical protein
MDNSITQYKPNNLTRESSTSSISTESDYENYVIKTKICTRLSKELNLEEINYDDIDVSDYEIPKKHGLSNSNIIIPGFFLLDKSPSKILDIDYFYIIKNDIRNLVPLGRTKICARICSLDWAVMGLPQSGQWPSPILAKRTRR